MILKDEDNEKILEGLVSVSPPTVVSCTTLLGIPLSDWVYISTIIYTLVGILTLIKRYWIDPWREQRKKLLAIQYRRDIYDKQERRAIKSDT